MQSRFSTMQSNRASLSATWNPTRGCPWCTSTTAFAPRWRWWRRQLTHWAWGPTTSTPWALPPRNCPRSSRNRCPSWRSRTKSTTCDRRLVRCPFDLSTILTLQCQLHSRMPLYGTAHIWKLILYGWMRMIASSFKTCIPFLKWRGYWEYWSFAN